MLCAGLLLVFALGADARAAQPAVGLGTADAFAVLGGSTVTNTGPTVINGALGVGPGSAVTGFPPGLVNGTVHAADAVAAQAQADLTAAYNDAAGRTPPALLPADAGGLFLTPGVYQRASSLGLTGNVTLDAQGDPSAVFILQAGTLTTASNGRVALTGGAQACNIFWQIGSSATLGTNTAFVGNILAQQSITLNTLATVIGRTLARNGAVTLDSNTVSRQDCAPGTTPGTGPGGGGTGSGGGATTGGGTTPGDTTGTGGVRAPGTGTVPGSATTPGGASSPAATTPAGRAAASEGSALLLTQPRDVGRQIARFGTNRCVDGAFRVSVSGRLIHQVTFLVDGHGIATQFKAPFAAMIRLHSGTHKVRAHVVFEDGTRSRNIRFHFRACTPQARRASAAPQFTG
jgi:hypothetical protein